MSNASQLSRRSFLKGSVSSAGLAAASSVAFSTWPVLGANDRINVAVIGVRSRGRDHIAAFAKQPNCSITTICDIDLGEAARGQALVEELQGKKPEVVQDLRRVFDNKNIDVVTIATPNHWHALATVWACQAGKDVYVEKPASHNIWEGQRMVDAARKYQRMVQIGLQAHSIEHYRRAMEMLHQGAIGKVYMAKGLCFKRRKSIGHQPDGPVPEGVDYDLWVGPAEKRPFNPNRFHYNWHWFWNTGNGDIGNQGIHEMDIARWGLGKTGVAPQVFCSGAKYIYSDDQETPNTQISILRYPDSSQIIFEVRGLMTQGEGDMNLEGPNYIGVIFLGSEGTLSLDSQGFKVFMGDERKLAHEMKYTEEEAWATWPHAANFLKAVQSRKHEDLTCDVGETYPSVVMNHMSNISYRTQRPLVFDATAGNFGDDHEANSYLSRSYRAPYIVPDHV
jgi:predicted dehydrogenase